MSLTKGACTYRLSVCLASCVVCMQACEFCMRARLCFIVACMGAYVRVFVSACVMWGVYACGMCVSACVMWDVCVCVCMCVFMCVCVCVCVCVCDVGYVVCS